MFRPAVQSFGFALRQSLLNANAHSLPAVRCMNAHGKKETDDELDARYENYFNRPDIDGWEIRKAINDMHGMDLVTEPKIIVAVLKACRRINDYSLTTRYLESIKFKCGKQVKEIYPYILQEIRPTLNELGISTPEELGYGEPELYLQDVFDM